MTRTIVLAVALLGCGGGDATVDAPPGSDPDARIDAGPGGTTITLSMYTIDGTPANVDTVLVSDDGGAWQPVTGVGGVYTATVVGPRYAIARTCIDPDTEYKEAYLYFLTLDDAVALDDIGCRKATGGVVTVSGGLTTVAADQRALVMLGESYQIFTQSGATDYQVVVPPGTMDLVARLGPNGQPRPVQRLVIERDLAVTGDLVHDIDFITDGFDPVEHLITVAGAGGADVEGVSVRLVGSTRLGFSIESNQEDTDRYRAPPAARMRTGELLTVGRYSTSPTRYRRATVTTAAPADLTAAYDPDYVVNPPVLVTTTAPIRLSGSLPHVAGADLYSANAYVLDDTGTAYTGWSQIYTARWADGATIAYEYEDLTGIGGWNVGLPAGELTWFSDATTSTQRTLLPVYYPVDHVDGDVETSSGSEGVLTVP